MSHTPNLDLGRNADGTYSVGEFVLCDGRSVESYTNNVPSAKISITAPNYSDHMYERAGCYKLIERRLYMGNSGANPFQPIRISSLTDLTTNGVYFIDKTTQYQQTKFNIHICDGNPIDTLLEEDYGFMPNYTSLFRGNTIAILVGKRLALGDYVIVDNKTIIDNGLRVSDGANISINDITYRHPLINNNRLNSLNGSLVVKNEEFSSPFFDGVIGKCVKIGDYIYTEGKAREDGWKLVRVPLNRGVTGEFEYAPIPSQLQGANFNKCTIQISDFTICIEETLVELTKDQERARMLKLDYNYTYSSIKDDFTSEGKYYSVTEIENWFRYDLIDQPIKYYFTSDYVNWEVNRIQMFQSKWITRQIGSELWASWGSKWVGPADDEYKEAAIAEKSKANGRWEVDSKSIVSSGTLGYNERSPRASINLIRYDGKGNLYFAGEGSRSYYNRDSGDSWETYNMMVGFKNSTKYSSYNRKGLVSRSEMLRESGYSWTSDATFRNGVAYYGYSWYQSTDGWSPSAMKPIKKEYSYELVFGEEEPISDSGRRSYEYVSSSTMNYKGSYSGVMAGRNRYVGDTWYSTSFSDTKTETLVTPMTIAGFSGNKPVMQSNIYIENKTTSVPNARVYVKLK